MNRPLLPWLYAMFLIWRWHRARPPFSRRERFWKELRPIHTSTDGPDCRLVLPEALLVIQASDVRRAIDRADNPPPRGP